MIARFKGTHLCIISTFDNILKNIATKNPTFLIKYDFSNAFGTIDHKIFLKTFKKLNVRSDVYKFVEGYLSNQQVTQTVVKDQHGSYLSDKTYMKKGTVQGQLGSDVCFCIQQLCLRELDGVQRSIYVDDINDIISSSKLENVLKLIKDNEDQLSLQSKKIGFKLNEQKTEYIPFNVLQKDVKNLNFSRNSKLLGIPFNSTQKGFDLQS